MSEQTASSAVQGPQETIEETAKRMDISLWLKTARVLCATCGKPLEEAERLDPTNPESPVVAKPCPCGGTEIKPVALDPQRYVNRYMEEAMTCECQKTTLDDVRQAALDALKRHLQSPVPDAPSILAALAVWNETS